MPRLVVNSTDLLRRFHLDFTLIATPALLARGDLVILYSTGGGELNLIARQGMRLVLGFGMTLVLA